LISRCAGKTHQLLSLTLKERLNPHKRGGKVLRERKNKKRRRGSFGELLESIACERTLCENAAEPRKPQKKKDFLRFGEYAS